MCLKCIFRHFKPFLDYVFSTFKIFLGRSHSKKLKNTWSKLAWNGLKCILNTTLFLQFVFWKKEWKMTRSGPPLSVEFSTLFFMGSLIRVSRRLQRCHKWSSAEYSGGWRVEVSWCRAVAGQPPLCSWHRRYQWTAMRTSVSAQWSPVSHHTATGEALVLPRHQ